LGCWTLALTHYAFGNYKQIEIVIDSISEDGQQHVWLNWLPNVVN